VIQIFTVILNRAVVATLVGRSALIANTIFAANVRNAWRALAYARNASAAKNLSTTACVIVILARF
jgi:hypothetical protein